MYGKLKANKSKTVRSSPVFYPFSRLKSVVIGDKMASFSGKQDGILFLFAIFEHVFHSVDKIWHNTTL